MFRDKGISEAIKSSTSTEGQIPMAKWAILIGIDEYKLHDQVEGHPAYYTLNACTRDVFNIRDVLCEKWGFPLDHITMLVAGSSVETAVRDGQGLPTYENIVAGILAMRQRGKPGDILYIHFCGYTAEVTTILPQVRMSNPEPLDYALLPYNVLCDGKCIRDLELSVMLRKLIDYGLDLTLVVDGRSHPTMGTFSRTGGSIFSSDELASVSHGPWSQFGRHTRLQNPDPGVPFTRIWLNDWTGDWPYVPGASWHRPEYYDEATKEWHGFLTYPLVQLLRTEEQNIACLSFLRKLSGEFESIYRRTQSIFLDLPHRMYLETSLNRTFLAIDWDPILRPHYIPRMLRLLPEFNYQLIDWGILLQSHAINGQHGSLSPLDHAAGEPKKSAYGDSSSHADESPVVLSPAVQASFYHAFLRIRCRPSGLSRDTKVSITGGYGYRKTGPPRVPHFSENGIVNMVSGDYLVINIATLVDQPLFVRVLHFDDAFGITQSFPIVGGVHPTMRPNISPRDKRKVSTVNRVATSLRLDLRLSLPKAPRTARTVNSATQILKIIMSDSPFSREEIDCLPVQDEAFLSEHQDPATETIYSGVSRNGAVNDFHDRSIQPDLQEQAGPIPIVAGDAPQDAQLCSYTVAVRVHSSEEGLIKQKPL